MRYTEEDMDFAYECGVGDGFNHDTKGWKSDFEKKSKQASDSISKLQDYLENTPDEEIKKAWKQTEKYDAVGPKASDFIAGLRPETAWRPNLIEQVKLVINDTEQEHPYKVKGDLDTYSQYNEGWSDACDVLGEKILNILNRRENG